MGPGGLLTVFVIQLAALLAPLAIGLTGLISGATAGLASILAWFILGIPLSYGAVETQSAPRAEMQSRTSPASDVPSRRRTSERVAGGVGWRLSSRSLP